MVNPPPAGSTPANPTAPNPSSGGATAASGSGNSGAPATSASGVSPVPNVPNPTSNFTNTLGPGNVIYCEYLVSDPTWTTSYLLSMPESNWAEWSRRLTLLSGSNSVLKYLTGDMICPDPVQYPTAHHIWCNTDQSLRSFILACIDRDEYDAVSGLDMAHAVFTALRTCHEKLGLHAQINLLRKVFDMQFDQHAPMEDTLHTVLNIHDRITKMGILDNNKLLSVILVNCLDRHFPQLQSEIHGMTDNTTYSSVDTVKRIHTEANLRKRRAEMGSPTHAVALAATSTNGKEAPVVCSNCKWLHHTIDFCVKRGGKMAGRSVEDAKAAQCLAAGKPARATSTALGGGTTNHSSVLAAIAAPSNNTVNTSPSAVNTTHSVIAPLGSVMIHGVPYALTPMHPAAPSTLTATANIATNTPFLPTATVGATGNMTDLVQYSAFMSDHNASRASLDWKEFAHDINTRSLEALAAESGMAPLPTKDCPFLMDTGATCHISPNRKDFLKLSPIVAHPVHSLGDSCIYAVGMGVLHQENVKTLNAS
jgi:hypothetical protein